jgi:hypothetical protein
LKIPLYAFMCPRKRTSTQGVAVAGMMSQSRRSRAATATQSRVVCEPGHENRIKATNKKLMEPITDASPVFYRFFMPRLAITLYTRVSEFHDRVSVWRKRA